MTLAALILGFLLVDWSHRGQDETSQLNPHRQAIGLDPQTFNPQDPSTLAPLHRQALTAAREVNETTLTDLHESLLRIRQRIAEGTLDTADAFRAYQERVGQIFDHADEHRAETIAWTETTRSVHLATVQAAKKSGVAIGLEWLVTAGACPFCLTLEGRIVRLDQPFATGVGRNPLYSTVYHPPGHPRCLCSIRTIVNPAISGLPAPTFSPTLHNPLALIGQTLEDFINGR